MEPERFITTFKRARHWSIFWARWIQSTPSHPILVRSILYFLVLPNGLFPPGIPTEILYAILISSMRATCPAHLILLYMYTIIIFGVIYKLMTLLV